ncbi:hypothetical protein BDY24DRAFT_259520 [Mrakia frigida]|uniref:uncharacterized protein n=1 Tax=Mrakia frigida TaxID=29902 RepID=UPI003FCC11C9
MTVSIEPLNSSDPRSSAVQVPFHMLRGDLFWTPRADPIATAAMISAGGALVSKNRILAWPSLLIAIFSFVNSKPLRTSDSTVGAGGLQGLGLSISVEGGSTRSFALLSLLSVYVPTFMILPDLASKITENQARVQAEAAASKAL